MGRTSSLAAALTFALTVSHIGSAAQKPSSDSTPAAIRIDAIVTDKHGKPIVNLKPSDFEVRENGVAQKIESVELTSRASGRIAGVALEPASPIGDTTSKADEERAAREPGTRVFALYLDEFHVGAGEPTEHVRRAMTRFLDEEVRPADLVAIMKPLDHLTEIRFTRDRDVARAVIAAFSGRKDDYAPRTPFEEQYMGRSPEAVRLARAQIVMSGLRALAARIGDLGGGLASVTLISEGFDTDVPRSRERRLPDEQALLRAAGRARVLFYALDPGSLPSAVTAADDDAEPKPSPMAPFEALARQTGGESMTAGHDLFVALQRTVRDLDAYYVLSYRSTGPSDGRFRKLEITSNRRDTFVRTRSGYWAPSPVEFRTRVITPPPVTAMRALRRSPFIQSWVGLTMDPDGNRRAIFTWAPTEGPIKSTRAVGKAEVVTVKVTNVAGKLLYEGEVRPARSSSASAPLPRTDSATFVVAPGRLQFDLTISRSDGSRLDVGAQDFDVPEPKQGNPIILQPQLFRAASAREFRELSTDANAAPLPGREFRRTDRMLLRVPAFDPSGKQVKISAKLINRVGSLLYDMTPMPHEDGVNLTQFDLPLARFAPGEYSIEIAAASESGLTRELIRLRITG